MATETKTQREAAGNKASATRRRTASKRSATRTKASATQTRSAARSTGRAARSTATEAGRTANRRADAAASSFEALVRQAERTMVLIPVGAALEARDAAVNTVRAYTQRRSARLRFNRFERRGEKALKRRYRQPGGPASRAGCEIRIPPSLRHVPTRQDPHRGRVGRGAHSVTGGTVGGDRARARSALPAPA
jgi:hypothetical protein